MIGKIGRLAKGIREQVNLMLADDISAKVIVDWLNGLPEVRAVMAREFGGRPVRVQNVSEWRQRGYRAWVNQQEAREMVERMRADTAELSAGSKGSLAEELAGWLVTQYVVAARELEQDGALDWKRLRELTRDVVALRRGEHWAERAKLERERLAQQEARAKADEESRFWRWAMEPTNRARICKGFTTQAQKIQTLGQLMYGDYWMDEVEKKAARQREAERVLAEYEAAELVAAAAAVGYQAKCPDAELQMVTREDGWVEQKSTSKHQTPSKIPKAEGKHRTSNAKHQNNS